MVAAAIVPVLKPVASKKTAKKDALVLMGHEDVATRVRDRARLLDNLETEQKQDAAVLIDAARSFRREAEASGNFHKMVKVATDTDPISLVFSDRYSPVAVENEPALREALGASYDAMFRREVKVSQRQDLNLDALKALLGDKFVAFAAAFDVKEVLTPVDGFMETRANLRPMLGTALNATVDGIIDQVQYKPSVRTK